MLAMSQLGVRRLTPDGDVRYPTAHQTVFGGGERQTVMSWDEFDPVCSALKPEEAMSVVVELF